MTRAQCAALLAQTKSLEGRLLARLLTSDESTTREANHGDRLLTVTEAAQLLAVTKSYLYHHAKRLGFAVKLGDGTLRFSRARIQQYMLENVVKPHARRAKKAA
jgi:excisionase family DNA binding protein